MESQSLRWNTNQSCRSGDDSVQWRPIGRRSWNDLTSNIVLGDDFDALGLQVCDEEFQEMLFGSGYSPYMNRAFYSNAENKQFWQQNFGAMLATPQGKSDFMSYKRLIVSKRLREKFDNLVPPECTRMPWKASTTS